MTKVQKIIQKLNASPSNLGGYDLEQLSEELGSINFRVFLLLIDKKRYESLIKDLDLNTQDGKEIMGEVLPSYFSTIRKIKNLEVSSEIGPKTNLDPLLVDLISRSNNPIRA